MKYFWEVQHEKDDFTAGHTNDFGRWMQETLWILPPTQFAGRYGGVKYRYIRNLQGDIVGIIDSAGTIVVEYKYDAWGVPISISSESSKEESLSGVAYIDRVYYSHTEGLGSSQVFEDRYYTEWDGLNILNLIIW